MYTELDGVRHTNDKDQFRFFWLLPVGQSKIAMQLIENGIFMFPLCGHMPPYDRKITFKQRTYPCGSGEKKCWKQTLERICNPIVDNPLKLNESVSG